MISRARFGRTGHENSRVGFGAVALNEVSHTEADAAIELVLATGVNHIDTAACEGDELLRKGDVQLVF